MSITPHKYLAALMYKLKDSPDETREPVRPAGGLLALSPLLVFLAVYLLSSILARDFYKVPIASAFLVSSIYALCICKGGTVSSRISIFSEGASDKNVMLMIWIFVLSGAFASTAGEIGAIESTVNFTLKVLPGKMLLSGLFLASCFISLAIGTSVGTIAALVPVAAGIATKTGISVPLVTAAIVGGAFFGDNLSFISDTTIAATRTQGCAMSDKFKANIRLAAPAAIIVFAIYVFIGLRFDAVPEAGHVDLVLLLPYLLIIVLAFIGLNVALVLVCGLVLNLLIGLVKGSMGWISFLVSVGDGIAGMGELIIVTLLAGGMLEVVRRNGGLDFLIQSLSRHIKGRRGGELAIAAIVSLANICTANNTIAIITTGPIAKDISGKYGISPKRAASILDTFSCTIQGLLPYGAQMLMASGLAGIGALPIIARLYYPFALGIIALGAILLGIRTDGKPAA